MESMDLGPVVGPVQALPSEQRSIAGDSRDYHRAKNLLGAALRMLRLHVRCTCAFSDGRHASTCHVMRACLLALAADEIGVGTHRNLKEKEDRMLIRPNAAARAVGRAFLALLLLAVPLSGQVVADTVRITIEGDLAVVTIQVPDTVLAIGDSIQFTALTFDSEGDPVQALLTWVSADPTALQINPETGLGVALRKANVDVIVRAERIGDLLLATFRNGQLNWEGNDTIGPGEQIQFCAFLVDPAFYLLAEDPGAPLCPLVFQPRPESSGGVFAMVSRRRSLFGVLQD